MLEKLLEVLNAKQKAKLIESASPKELRQMFPQIADMSKKELNLLWQAIARIIGAEKPRKRRIKVESPFPQISGIDKPKRKYTRKAKISKFVEANEEGKLVPKTTHTRKYHQGKLVSEEGPTTSEE